MSDRKLKKTDSNTVKESEYLYLNLINMTPVPILLISKDKIVYGNPKAITFFGAKAKKKIIGQSIFTFVHPDSKKSFQKKLTAKGSVAKSS